MQTTKSYPWKGMERKDPGTRTLFIQSAGGGETSERESIGLLRDRANNPIVAGLSIRKPRLHATSQRSSSRDGLLMAKESTPIKGRSKCPNSVLWTAATFPRVDSRNEKGSLNPCQRPTI
eukprot:scaffold2639_cov361-Pavlova_lutheri.AAC.53